MALGTPLSNVALRFLSSYVAITSLHLSLCSAESGLSEAVTTPLPLPKLPLPSNGGNLDAWAAASSVDAAGLAVDFCIDRYADSVAYAACKQSVLIDSSACSEQCKACDAHDRWARYEACMDGNLFDSGCANKTRERFWNEALKEASSKVPMKWDKGIHCNTTQDLEKDPIFSSFWDTLCKNKASAACFPEPKPKKKAAAKKGSLLQVSKQHHGAGYKREVYRQWLRHRLLKAVDMPSCRETKLIQVEAAEVDREEVKLDTPGRQLRHAKEHRFGV